MTPEEYKATAKPAKKSKYRNVKTEMDGIMFDSKKEAKRWHDLNIMEGMGLISDLRRQVVYPLEVKGWHICNYVADHVYRDERGMVVVEDVKSDFTRRVPLYRVKKRLMEAVHNITILEVM